MEEGWFPRVRAAKEESAWWEEVEALRGLEEEEGERREKKV